MLMEWECEDDRKINKGYDGKCYEEDRGKEENAWNRVRWKCRTRERTTNIWEIKRKRRRKKLFKIESKNYIL